ncbi:MAG: hypothetical protein HY717_21220 [Planctomycetes bacterium]|nr:hypothetical protein [Planctomycetota bacterium]
MHRHQLEHAIRASSVITGETEFIVIGSSALLGSFPNAPAELTASLEVDIYPRQDPKAADKLNVIGELSLFHQTHGFWVDPVGPETATLPPGWESRLVPVSNANTNHAVGWCLEVHDMAVSKLFAGRDKDMDFIRGLLNHGFINKDRLNDFIQGVQIDEKQKLAAMNRLAALHQK